MKKILYSAIIFIFMFYSCKKDHKESIHSVNDTIEPYKTVYYKHYIPDTCILFPTSNDSISYFDLNNDSIMDICFAIHRWREWIGPHPPFYCFYSIAYSVDSLHLIYQPTSYGTGCSVPLDSATYFHVHDSTTNTFSFLWVVWPSACTHIYAKKYIGFSFKKKGIEYLGWIHLNVGNNAEIYIEDYATLLSSSDSIKTGDH